MPERIGYKVLWGAAMLAAVAFAFAGWTLVVSRHGGKPSDSSPPGAETIGRPPDHNEVTLSANQRRKGGIVVAPLRSTSFQEEIVAYGIVSGTRELADSRSNYAARQAQRESSQAELAASRENYERLRLLYSENQNTSQESVQKAKATWLSDEARARAAEAALQSQMIVVRQQWGNVIAGWIEDGNSTPFVRLMEREDVLLQITTPIGTLVSSPPAEAIIETPSGKSETATFVAPAPRTDPRIQGFSFFYLAPAKATDLLPGMNISARLALGPQAAGVFVPASAVVWLRGRAWVYVQTGPWTFLRREVPMDAPMQGGWFAREGFSAGEQCVVQGAQLLLSQESHGPAPKGDEDED